MTYTRYWRAQPVKSDKVKIPRHKIEKFVSNLNNSLKQNVQRIPLPKELVISQANSIKPTIDCSKPQTEGSTDHAVKLPPRVLFELAKHVREYKNGYGRAEGQREVEEWMRQQKDETMQKGKWMGNVLHGHDVMGMEQDVREMLEEHSRGEDEIKKKKSSSVLAQMQELKEIPYDAICVVNGITEAMKRCMFLLGEGEYIVPEVSTPELKRVWQSCASSLKSYHYRSCPKKDPWDNEPDPEELAKEQPKKKKFQKRRRVSQKKVDPFLSEWRLNVKEIFYQVTLDTKAIVINYPCPVTGAVWSRQSLNNLIQTAREQCIPLIVNQSDYLLTHSRRIHSDQSAELQLYTVFEDIGCLQSQGRVPVFTINSIVNSHLVEGWHLAWMCLYDCRERIMEKHQFLEVFNNAREMRKEPSTFLQCSLPHLLSSKIEQLYVNKVRRHCELNFRFLKTKLEKIDGITMNAMPESGLFVPLQIDVRSFDSWIRDDETFCNLFFEEESVKTTPGSVYGMKNFFLLCLFVDRVWLRRAIERLEDFCLIHFVRNK
uniref:Aminotransferase class I/classII large domain-containing protein n=1 Tax=Percolomonas cosmopolitus TaxID=63605 RepID=A0A7S1KKW3_9EUKA|mmetsp:Transcript_10163/g.37825  ORF Transcript_10163/g.37825 Transcript_10163/m.37825 type:complete len:543 (+) Transcript_10163:79-1707(+)